MLKQVFKKQTLKKDSDKSFDDIMHEYLLIIAFSKKKIMVILKTYIEWR